VIFTHLLQSASLIPTDTSALESAISALETAISELEAEIRALNTRSVPWEHALPWFTFAVIVGVAMEWWVIRHDFREEMETWAIFDFVGVIRFPSRPSVRKLVVEIAGVALIVFGIFGELGIGLEIASINNSLRAKSTELRSKNAELRSKSNILLALVTQQAGEAADSAQKARDAAKQAWEYAAWRTISDKQAVMIRARIHSLKGHVFLYFGNFEDSETLRFANRLIGILDNGIMEAKPGVWQTGMMTEPGFKFGYGKGRKKDFDLLVEALDAAGVEKAGVLRSKSSSKGWGDDTLAITFGARH
jgi:hypothetical protein